MSEVGQCRLILIRFTASQDEGHNWECPVAMRFQHMLHHCQLKICRADYSFSSVPAQYDVEGTASVDIN